ncbi:MAG: hypothetical protein DMF56_06155 [Acidobacteria bacterium]|nr:MAG: hypothetical protein DMF56_06155 [Acidobacteriota bacterium]
MRDARKALLWLATLLFVVMAGDRLLSWMLARVLVRSQFRYSQLYRGGTNADILIMGDSRGVNSFYAPAIEELTGKKAFNLSYNSMSPVVAEALLLDYLDRNRPPKMVIFEPTCVMVDGAVLTELRPFATLSPRLMALYQERHPDAARMEKIFHLLLLNTGFFVDALHYMRQSDQDWIMRGSLPETSEPEGKRVVPFLPGNREALQRIVTALRRRGVEVRFVIAPYYAKGIENLPQLIAGLPLDDHVRVATYDTVFHDPALFADHVHLNEKGSREFLAMLRRDGVLALPGEGMGGQRPRL